MASSSEIHRIVRTKVGDQNAINTFLSSIAGKLLPLGMVANTTKSMYQYTSSLNFQYDFAELDLIYNSTDDASVITAYNTLVATEPNTTTWTETVTWST